MINVHEMNPDFKSEVAKVHGGENIKNCFACGTCTVSCPVFATNPEYNPRKIIRMVILGMKEVVLKSDFIWLCSGCYNCYELCPRDVKITDLMGAIRNIAVKNGHLPDAHMASLELLEKYGRLLEVSEFENKVREKKDIPLLKAEIPDIKSLMDKTGVMDIVGGDNDE